MNVLNKIWSCGLLREDRHTKAEEGACMIEYALLASILSLVVMGAISFAGKETSETFQVAGKAMAGEEKTEVVAASSNSTWLGP